MGASPLRGDRAIRYRVWVVPQAQPHIGKPLRGMCYRSILCYAKDASRPFYPLRSARKCLKFNR
jgi:hypothetical protein